MVNGNLLLIIAKQLTIPWNQHFVAASRGANLPRYTAQVPRAGDGNCHGGAGAKNPGQVAGDSWVSPGEGSDLLVVLLTQFPVF